MTVAAVFGKVRELYTENEINKMTNFELVRACDRIEMGNPEKMMIAKVEAELEAARNYKEKPKGQNWWEER